MIKRVVLFVFVFLFLICGVSAVNVAMNEEYDLEETMIVKISGVFEAPLSSENIYFYQGHVESQFDFDFGKIGSSYYVSVKTFGKSFGNYTFKIEDAVYSESGEIKSDTVEKNFSINDEVADFSIDKGFVSTKNPFFVEVESFADTDIEVSIKGSEEFSFPEIVSLAPGEKKNIDFSFSANDSLLSEINFASENTGYDFVVYVFGQSQTVESFCGDGVIDEGEECDSGFGNVSDCGDFGYDGGSLICENCLIDFSECYYNVEPDCENDGDCGNDEFCSFGNCYEEECNEDDDCNDDEFCDDHFCVDIVCEDKGDCRDGYFCIDEECVKQDCLRDRDCGDEKMCDDGECVEKPECVRNSDCLGDKSCDEGNCVSTEALVSCSAIGGDICGENQECNGEFQNIDGEICCEQTCETEESSSGKLIGWIIIIFAVLVLVVLYMKYKKMGKK